LIHDTLGLTFRVGLDGKWCWFPIALYIRITLTQPPEGTVFSFIYFHFVTP